MYCTHRTNLRFDYNFVKVLYIKLQPVEDVLYRPNILLFSHMAVRLQTMGQVNDK